MPISASHKMTVGRFLRICCSRTCGPKAQPGREPTVGDLGRLVARRHPRLVGTPEQIADQLEVWQQAGVDGLNIVNWMIPSSYREFADHLLPELQSRGLAKHAYAPGPLRQ
jgi:alkanesulfonate monooxygenase SsuD/methylene tetrahydromethanopterin reductase-like flavin-dependent oxidoreductase (luciferase family)